MAQTWGNAVRVDGLKELKLALKDVSPEIKREFNKSMKGIVTDMASAVRDQMPEVTGNAKASVRVSSTGNFLAIRAGGDKAPYYPWLDFGGAGVVGFKGTVHGRFRKTDKREYKKEGRWIYPTITEHRPDIYKRAMAAVTKASRAAGFRFRGTGR